MKRVVVMVLLSLLAFSATAYAAAVNGYYKGREIVRVFVDGKEIHSAVPGQIVDGSTMLPLRAIAEALGADVAWDQAAYSANITMPKELTLAELNKIAESVPIIYALDEYGYFFKYGAGFVYNDLVVTNHYVIEDAVALDIRFGEESQIIPMEDLEIVYNRHETEMVAFRMPGHKSLRLASDVKLGEKVYVLGHPNTRFTITEGTIKAYAQNNSDYTIVWSTAEMGPGGNGGPMINSKGEVVGLASGISVHTDKESYALHVKHLVQELDKVK